MYKLVNDAFEVHVFTEILNQTGALHAPDMFELKWEANDLEIN